jgi:hypothetical protein
MIAAAIKGKWGSHAQIDAYETPSEMLNYEFSWESKMEELDEYIRNFPTKDGQALAYRYSPW